MNDFAKLVTLFGVIAGIGTLYHAAQTGKWKDGHTAMAALTVATFVLPRLK